MILKYIILILGAVFFIYALIRKPEIVAVLLFTLVIAQINIFYLRPIVTLALFVRILFDKETQATYPSFLGQRYVKLLIVFLLYGLLVSFSQDLFSYDLFKGDVDMVMLTYIVYHFYFKQGSAAELRAAIIASGLICFGDLAYTYIVFGSFPMHRLTTLLTNPGATVSYEDIFAGINWNFFGQICGMCFVYVFCEYIKNRRANKYIVWLLPIMLLGVLMSTSRSSILGLLIMTILIVLNSINFQEQKKKVVKVTAMFIGASFMAVLTFATVGKYLNLDSGFIDGIVSRLSQEPVAIVKKALGQPYNIHNLGSMEWREESAENAYTAYMNMDFREQLVGIGIHGFEARNIGHGFDAHNATLLLLIEYGLIGFFLYFMIVGGLIIRSVLTKNFSPALYTTGFIIIYGLGQNREWTGWTTFLFVFCLLAEIQYQRMERKKMSYMLTRDRDADSSSATTNTLPINEQPN
jgi:hypothetical protein